MLNVMGNTKNLRENIHKLRIYDIVQDNLRGDSVCGLLQNVSETKNANNS